MSGNASRRGVTLVELLVVLTILGLLAGIAGVAMAVGRQEPAVSGTAARIQDARRRALTERHAVTISFAVDSVPREATAFPDGTVVADGEIEVDPLTGRSPHEP